jgi:hypothetical protein
MIDWNKLKPYKTSKEKSFEQLCFQIAVRLYENEGTFTPIDDSGGGDGVEFYLTTPLGEDWGWQAKYYEGRARLNDSNRKSAIIDSLKKALKIHPRLKKWFLCLPLDPTPDETRWIENELPKIIPADRQVEIVSWTHSSIHEKVNRPEFNGIWQAFFNSLELNSDWFTNAFNNSFSLVKNKFDELLYVPNAEFEYYYLNPALCNNHFRKRLDFYLPLLSELFEESLEKLEALDYTTEQFRPLFKAYKKEIETFNELYNKLCPILESRYVLVYPNSIDKLTPSDLEIEIDQLNKVFNDAKENFRAKIKDNIAEKNDEEKSLNSRQHQKIWAHEGKCSKLIEEIKYYVRDTCIPLKWQVSHYLGSGGTGTTNLCVAIAKSYLDAGYPVIFIPAIKFTGSNPLQEQLLSILDIRSGYSFADFIDTLNALGTIHNTRVPIVIDGLNEAITSGGELNQVLQRDMGMLEQEVSKRSNIVLITTSRPSYRDFFWPGSKKMDDKRFHSLYGFTNYNDIKSLVQRYFEVYKIQADYSFNSLQQFSKPIYIKIYCETENADKKLIKQVTLGYHSIYTIFEKYTNQIDDHIYKKLLGFGRPPLTKYRRLASNVTAKIADHLWNNPARALDLAELINIADPDGINNFNQSVTKAVLDEELLFMRDYGQENEQVYLTYDLMSGYFIAKYLIEHINDYSAFFKGPDIKKLTAHRHLSLHPVYEDVLTALCTLLPISKSIFVHDLIPQPAKEDEQEQRLINESLNATLILPPEYLPDEQINYIKSLLEVERNFVLILEKCEPVLFVTDHPFNFNVFDQYLERLPMNRRDVTWTEYNRNQDNSFRTELIAEFRRLHQLGTHSLEQTEKIRLASLYLFWNFTSTDKALKQEVADALFEYGKQYQEDFFNLYRRAVKINDPFVFEWMSQVGYNLILYLSRFDKKATPVMTQLGEFIKLNLFDPVSAFNTNHMLTRDYAFRTLEIILNSKKIADEIKRDFSKLGIQQWQVSEDKNEQDYREGNSLIHCRFEKDRMHPLGGGGNEYNHNPLYEERLGNLRWRAYELGYDFALFGEIDKTIARRQGYGDEFADTKRYADKYIDIAYNELWGYLEDHKLMRDIRESGSIRIEQPKFKPQEQEEFEASERFVTIDYIDADIPLKRFCNDHSIPAVDEYLNRTEFKGEAGNWQMLYGFFHQCKPEAERQIFCYMEAILIKKKDFLRALKDFPDSTNLGSTNDTPYTTNVLEGEIPDGRIIPQNNFHEWYYTMKSNKTVTIPYHRRVLYKDGVALSETENKKAWKLIYEKTGLIQPAADFTPGETIPLIRIVTRTGEKRPSLRAFLKSQSLEMKIEKIERIEERDSSKTIQIMYPVRSFSNHVYASKNIIEHFGLARTKENRDLYDQDGNLASISHHFENSFVDQESFAYLRKDLLNKYLRDEGLEMLYIVWGERDWYPVDGDWMKAGRKAQEREWAKFCEIISY